MFVVVGCWLLVVGCCQFVGLCIFWLFGVSFPVIYEHLSLTNVPRPITTPCRLLGCQFLVVGLGGCRLLVRSGGLSRSVWASWDWLGWVVVGCWLLVVGCCLLVVGCWLLVVGCGLWVVGCWWLVVGLGWAG